ncbi:2OG-Fe(II) oxygenase [Amycolatopsis sp. GM8]|uniref:2OG-Fe(II) oxygenase n=1 Tax=Amycolatopsis sp. GM8 TaxID=2896530 RepID=UPI001F32435B|nr:2OG-Fe(II) oxygenase [Amycolatopsis sp. GM8]
MTDAGSEIETEIVACLRAANLVRNPWDHAYLPTVVPPATALRLSRAFGKISLTDCEERERQKTYRFGTADLDPESVADDPDWAAFAMALNGSAYRRAMTELTGIPLADASLSLAVWEYREGDWLAPHVDKPDKVVTQIFYFTESWSESDRGRLLVLDRPDVSHPRLVLAPALGSSAVLVRSESSWHAVEPLSSSAPAPRRSLTATFRR